MATQSAVMVRSDNGLLKGDRVTVVTINRQDRKALVVREGERGHCLVELSSIELDS